MRTFSVLGTTLHDVSEDELLARLSDVRGLVVTPNPEMLLAAQAYSPYRDLLNRAVLALPDGIATVFAVAALYDIDDLHRHPGVDVVPMIATVAEQRGETLIVVGGYSEDHGSLRTKFGENHPKLRVLCIDPGLIAEDDPTLAAKHFDVIRNAGPSVVVVALGQGRGRMQGKQDAVAQAILEAAPNVRFAIGVGGAIDVLSGRIRRAPKRVQRFGFEWFWRLFANPWRFARIFRAVVIFPIHIAWDTLRQRKFLRACHSVTLSLGTHFFTKSV